MYYQVAIFRTPNGCGWGVKTMELIEKHQLVTEYVGEAITQEEAEERGKVYDSCGQTYLFDLDFNEGECLYTLDAKKYGNISHFINHSVRMLPVVSFGRDPFNQISGNFGPKLNGAVRSNQKSFEKMGPPFEVDHFFQLDRLEFWLNGSRPLISTSMAIYHFINYSVRMLSVESFDTNKYIVLYSPYILCNNEDILLQIFGFCAIFSICFPLLLTSTSYPYIKSALPIMFFLFLSRTPRSFLQTCFSRVLVIICKE